MDGKSGGEDNRLRLFLDENTKIPPFLRQERRITVENLPPVQEIRGAVL